MKEDLLDRIARKMNVRCLSELHTFLGDTSFVRCVQEIPITDYSLSEWTECANYLLGVKKTFASEQQAKNDLIDKKEGCTRSFWK